MQKKYLVTAEWDGDASVWVATSSDIPGLVTEAATLDALVERIVEITPELLELNSHLLQSDDFDADLIDMCIMSTLRVDGHYAC